MRQRTQHVDGAAQRGERRFLRAGASHGQHTTGDGLHGVGKAQCAFFGDEPPDKGDELAARGHVQFGAPVYGVLGAGQFVQLIRINSVGQAARRRDAKGLQPAADVPRNAVEGEPTAADTAAGGVLIGFAQRPGQPAVHHIAGGVVDDQRRDAPPLALAGCPDALGVHPGLDDRKVDALRPQAASVNEGMQHREPPAHDRVRRQAKNFDAVGVGLPRGQTRQRRRDHKRPVPRRDAPPRQIPGIPLDPAGSGEVLGGEEANNHSVSLFIVQSLPA